VWIIIFYKIIKFINIKFYEKNYKIFYKNGTIFCKLLFIPKFISVFWKNSKQNYIKSVFLVVPIGMIFILFIAKYKKLTLHNNMYFDGKIKFIL